jgi:hypothetical protein
MSNVGQESLKLTGLPAALKVVGEAPSITAPASEDQADSSSSTG